MVTATEQRPKTVSLSIISFGDPRLGQTETYELDLGSLWVKRTKVPEAILKADDSRDLRGFDLRETTNPWQKAIGAVLEHCTYILELCYNPALPLSANQRAFFYQNWHNQVHYDVIPDFGGPTPDIEKVRAAIKEANAKWLWQLLMAVQDKKNST